MNLKNQFCFFLLDIVTLEKNSLEILWENNFSPSEPSEILEMKDYLTLLSDLLMMFKCSVWSPQTNLDSCITSLSPSAQGGLADSYL